MAIQIRALNTITQTTGPHSGSVPAGMSTGDLMLLWVGPNSAAPSAPEIAGWLPIPRSFINGSQGIYLFYRIVEPSEPSTYTITQNSGAIIGHAVIALYSDTGSPLSIDAVAQQINTSSTNRTFPSVTTLAANSMLLCFGSFSSGSSTPDALMTERWDANTNQRGYLMTQIVAAAGATGTRTATGTAQATKTVSIAISENTQVPFVGPQYRGLNTYAFASSSSPRDLPAVAGQQQGDLLFAQLSFNTDPTAITPPSGWAAVPGGSIGGTNCIYTFYKVAGASEPSNYSWAWTGGTKLLVMVLVAINSPAFKDLYIDAVASSNNASSGNYTFAQVTTTKTYAMLLLMGALDSNLAITAPLHTYETYELGSGPRAFGLREWLTTAGATGTRTPTGSAATSRCITIAVAERLYPGDPTGLTASAVSDSQINLSWTDAATTETGYKIERSPNGSTSWTQIADIAANSTSYSDTGLAEYTTYYYRVFAYNTDGPSGYSNTANAKTKLIAPTSLTATAVSDEQIDLVWVDNSAAESGYKIERSNNGSTGWTVIHTTAADVESYSDTGLADNVTRYYRVRAYNGSDFSDYSNTDSDTTAPAAASSLVATAISGTRIDLTWADDSTGEDGFSIERKTGIGGTYAEIATVGANVESYSDTTVAENTTYYYRIRAYVGAVYSGYSNVANETTPADFSAPADVTATALGPRRIRIEWTDPNTNELGYLVERSFFADDGFIQIASLAAGAIQYTDTGLEPESTYYYRVRGYK